MSRFGGLALLTGAFCIIVIAPTRFVLGSWHPALYGFLALLIASLIVSVVFDYRLYLEILSIKTAKKGLSLGWSIVATLLFLSALSYLGHRFDRSFDLSKEGINSLSEQSAMALKDLDSDLVFYVFYRGGQISPEISAIKAELKEDIKLYRQSNSRVRLVFKDVRKDNLKAEEYLANLPDKQNQQLFVFVNYKGRKVRADAPFEEEDLTSAVIKAKKREFKEIVFLTGHGEKDLNSAEPGGLKILNQALTDSGFTLREWHFMESGGAPTSSPAAVMIVGPIRPLASAEEVWLKDYLSQGGNLFLAIDPGERHNMAPFLAGWGLNFKNHIILTLELTVRGVSPSSRAVGVEFDRLHPATKKLSEGRVPVFFDRASSWDISSDERFKGFSFSHLLKSQNSSFLVPRLEEKLIRDKFKERKFASFTMAVGVEGRLPSLDKGSKGDKSAKSKGAVLKEDKAKPEGESDKGQNFRLAVFGDSDFLNNGSLYNGANRDLALNALAWLAGEEDLISIRPKMPKGTKIYLHKSQRIILVFFYIAIPCLFLFVALLIWLKRRSM